MAGVSALVIEDALILNGVSERKGEVTGNRTNLRQRRLRLRNQFRCSRWIQDAVFRRRL